MDRRDRAFALMIAVVTVSAVFATAVSVAVVMRTATVESGAVRRLYAQELPARSAAARALAGLVGEDASPSSVEETGAEQGPLVDTEKLPEMPEFLKAFLEGQLGDEDQPSNAAPPPPTSTRNASRYLSLRGMPAGPVRVTIDDAVYAVALADPWGVINLNSAEPEEFAGLCAELGVDRALADRLADELVDYRDPDDFVSPRGAEQEAYRRRGMQIPNAPLASPDELLFLPSMTHEVYDRVEPFVTVFGDGKIHVPSAPRAVLAALPGMSPAAVREILALRASGGLTARTLQKALPLMEGSLPGRLRLKPSPAVEVRVRRADAPGPEFVGTAVVSPDEGIQWIAFGAL